MKQSHLLVGEIVRPQGIKGEVKLRHYTDDPHRFEELETVLRKVGDGYTPLVIDAVRVNGDDVFLKLEGCDDRNEAEKLRGAMLYVDRANARELSEDEVFIADILGAKAEDTQGKPIGILKDVLTPGSTDVFVFDTPKGRLMVPALKTVILSWDVDNGRIVLDENKLSEVSLYEDSHTDVVPRDV